MTHSKTFANPDYIVLSVVMNSKELENLMTFVKVCFSYDPTPSLRDEPDPNFRKIMKPG